VESRADWEDMKRRYDPAHPARLPEAAAAAGAKLKNRQHAIAFVSRSLLAVAGVAGFENLCMMFCDDPGSSRR